MVRATGIESNGGADEDIAIDTPAMSAAVIGDIIDALAGVLSCSREVIELAVMTLVAGGHLLPSDLTGVSVYSQATGSFDFHPGPLFANIVIADEVNRANPKAQSAMLEAMGEGQISG